MVGGASDVIENVSEIWPNLYCLRIISYHQINKSYCLLLVQIQIILLKYVF